MTFAEVAGLLEKMAEYPEVFGEESEAENPEKFCEAYDLAIKIIKELENILNEIDLIRFQAMRYYDDRRDVGLMLAKEILKNHLRFIEDADTPTWREIQYNMKYDYVPPKSDSEKLAEITKIIKKWHDEGYTCNFDTNWAIYKILGGCKE